MKKTLSLFLSVLMMLSVFTVAAFAVEAPELKNLECTYDGVALTWDASDDAINYLVYRAEGDGDLIERGDIVTLEYEVDLITGDRVYSSKEDGNKTFVVGRGGVESGLEEAILKLRNNSVAVLILPSHLAHGLLGDGERIPPKSPIVYYVKVIDVKNK